MKLNGNDFSNEEVVYGPLVLDRGGTLFSLFVRPCWSFDEFDRKVKAPEAPETLFTPEGKKPNYEDPQYLADCEEYENKRTGYMILQSLRGNGLELPGVDPDNPDTWAIVEKQLQAGEHNPNGLLQYEYARLTKLLFEANAMDSRKLEANLKTFLEQSGGGTGNNPPPTTEAQDQVNTKSGEPVSVSA